MEDDPIGRQPKWKMTQMEDNPNGRQPKKTTQMEDDPNGRQPKWKMTQIEDENPKGKTMFKTRGVSPSVALLSPSLFLFLLSLT